MADYGASDTSTTALGTNQFPISEVYVPNTGLKALGGGPKQTDGTNKDYAPALMYIQDGSDVSGGATTDVAVTGDNPGTRSAKLRGLLKIWTDIWDSVNHRIKVDGSGVTQPVSGTVTSNAGTNLNTSALALEAGHLATIDSHTPALGQAAMAVSVPVVIANNQSTVPTLDTNSAASKTDLDNISAVSGATTDAAVVGDNSGTVSAKLRGLTKIFNDVWDSVNHRIHVNVDNGNPNGQSTMANSAPVAIASDQSAVKTKGDYVEVAGQGTGVVNGNATDLIPATDVSAYKWLSLQLEGTFALTLSFQWSNDNVNFRPLTLLRNDSLAGTNAASSATTTGQGWNGPVFFRYFRVRVTSFTSNSSLAGTLELYTNPAAFLFNITQVAQSGTWTMSTQVADITVFASAAQTTTQTQADQTNPAAKGLRVVLDMTNVGTGSVTLEIDAKDVASGKYTPLLTGVAVTTISTNVYVIYPGLTPAANSIVSDVLPRTWRIKVTANNANSATYSVGASYLV